ncbi:dephospho-CoA kinase [Candidatus Poribacteria bacterium]|nr:MAG: dephospho-CoA kinase [Candidatus Poribacteria bacterium]
MCLLYNVEFSIFWDYVKFFASHETISRPLTNFSAWYTLKCMETETTHRTRGTIVGITGGIACGKTTVSELLAEKGAIPINADEIGHRLLKADSPVIDELTDAFGHDILDASGDVSRKKLGAIVFKDKTARECLNSILHPLIIQRSREQARRLVTEDPMCVVLLDAPLLIEAGAYDTVDLIVVVTAPPETQLRRTLERSIAQRRPLTETEVQARIDSQMPVSEKVKYADVVIQNEGTLEDLHKQVDELWERLQTHNEMP